MKRHIQFVALAALGITLALQAGTASAGGFKFGGGGGGGGGGGMSTLRSGISHGGNGGGGTFRSLPSGGNSVKPMIGSNSPLRGITSQNLGGGLQKGPTLNKIGGPGSPLLSQGGITQNARPNIVKQAGGPLGGGNMPSVNPNVLKGNVKSHLIGNGTGANPRNIIGNVGPKVGIGGQNIVGGPKGPIGGIQGKIGAAVGNPVGGKIGIGGGGPKPNIGIGVGNHIGGHHDKFCGTPWPGKGKADCHHVINLLVKHCVAKNHYEPCVKHYCPPPVFIDHGWIPVPVQVAVPVPVGVPGLGDLELVEVGMLTDATGELGPLYQVTIRNSGDGVAEQFRVSMVAVLGEITEDSPSITVNVERLAPGETATVQVQLPGAVLAMGPEGEAAIGFDTLVVAVDSFDELVEANELNNVATLKRAEITVVQVGAVATETTVATETAPAVVGETTVEGAEEVPAPVEGEDPVEGGAAPPANAPSPMEDIDIDNLDLGEADSAAVQFE